MAQENIQISVPIIGTTANPVAYANQIKDGNTTQSDINTALLRDTADLKQDVEGLTTDIAGIEEEVDSKIDGVTFATTKNEASVVLGQGATFRIEPGTGMKVDRASVGGAPIDGAVLSVDTDVIPIPDEEDLTNVNVGGTGVLKFKDKAYAPADYSGLGRVYLRKNMTVVSLPFDGFLQTSPTIEQSSLADVPDAIFFDVQGERFVCQKDLKYYINWQNNEGYLTNLTDGDLFSFGDNYYEYNDGTLAVKENPAKTNVLTQSMINQANTIYVIQYDYDLNGQTITLPKGCVLYFDGGSLTNGKINGDVNVEGEYLSTLKVQVFVEGINFNLYQDDSAIKTSFIGMIPNDSTAAVYNKKLLSKIINSGKNVIMDDFYYIDHSECIVLSRELVIYGITDNAGMIFTSSLTDRSVFSMNAGSALKLHSLSLISHTLSYLVLNRQIDYLINSVIIQGCKFEDAWRIQITGADVDYSQTTFGIKNFIFTNNAIRNNVSFLLLEDIVISDRAIISDNIVTDMVYTFFNNGITNSYTYSENLKKYSAPLYVERNIVFGGICETSTYNTFLLVENNTVYYRYNHIENVLNVGSGVSYDGYVSSVNYYCEGNYFKNIATIPKSGTAKATSDEIGKSKGAGKIRSFNNNLWIQDYDKIKDILSNSYSEYSSMESSVYESLSCIAIFRYVATQEKIIFTNNKISINAGKIKNINSTTATLGIVRIENNIFDCPIEGAILAPRDNTSVYIENNEFLQQSLYYCVYTGNYILDELCVKNNVFNGTYGTSERSQKSYKVDVSNNKFIGNLEYKHHLFLPETIGNDGYVETKVSPTEDAKGSYFFNKSKVVVYFNMVSRYFIYPPNDSAYIKYDVLYNDVVLTEFYIERNGDVCNVYDKNLIFDKNVSANYTSYYSDNNISVEIMKNCAIVVNKVNGTYCEVRSEVLKTLPQKTFPNGLTVNRPSNVATGYQYFDTTLGKPIYFNGTGWVDATGITV